MSYQRHWFFTARHPTKEQHLKAVEMLIRVQKKGSTVDLGEVGTGIGAVSGRVCDLRSRGLAIIDGAIYSVFKWPWHAYLGDRTVADATLDRLVQNSYRLVLKGQSMRRHKSIASRPAITLREKVG